ncbi:hypothetical protein MNBD_NITROSPINAE04-2351 [hydrothermal vent metagenome]|uniref:Lipopolysaccharide assembly protein A domain-containing protein n=1 Tax=hydrothermal vent metagenome TaxID=652676 RepID=A0A3B1BQF4_9ZZZZ
MKAVKFVLGLVVIFVLVTFAIQNQQDTRISYYYGYVFNVQLWLAILASFAIGAVLAGIGSGFSVLRLKARNWSLSRKIDRLEKKVSELEQRPLPDEPNVYPAPGSTEPALLAAGEMKSIPAKAVGHGGGPD